MRLDGDTGYAIDILVTGYPGKSVCHGALGWSTIALLRGGGRVALIDVGSFAQRSLLHQKLRIGLGRRQLIALGRQAALGLSHLRFGCL